MEASDNRTPNQPHNTNHTRRRRTCSSRHAYGPVRCNSRAGEELCAMRFPGAGSGAWPRSHATRSHATCSWVDCIAEGTPLPKARTQCWDGCRSRLTRRRFWALSYGVSTPRRHPLRPHHLERPNSHTPAAYMCSPAALSASKGLFHVRHRSGHSSPASISWCPCELCIRSLNSRVGRCRSLFETLVAHSAPCQVCHPSLQTPRRTAAQAPRLLHHMGRRRNPSQGLARRPTGRVAIRRGRRRHAPARAPPPHAASNSRDAAAPSPLLPPAPAPQSSAPPSSPPG